MGTKAGHAIGVHDNGTPTGIEPDYKLISSEKDRSRDGFERKVRDLCDKRFNRRPIGLLTFRFAELDGKTVCRIDVTPSNDPTIWTRSFGYATETAPSP